MRHIAIIGNGIAGITAARYIRKQSDDAITVISAESKHFWSRTALMYIYMGHMRFEDTKPYEDFFWEKNKISLIQAYVQNVNTTDKKLSLSTGKDIHYDVLVIASGSTFNKFGWPGQDLEGVNGMYSIQDLEYMETYTHDIDRAVIVGGGLIGIEMAEMLHSRKIDVTFLVRENSYWRSVLPPEESEMVNRHIRENHIDLRLNTELKEILPDGNGRVRAVVTSKGDEIPCGFVGLTAGVHPTVGFLEGSGIETAKGILVNEYLQTNIPDVYAIGDCAQLREPQPGRKPVEAIWYVGKMMGETLAMTLTGTPKAYNPGIWFNSAKFFDIEYQIYGDVPGRMDENVMGSIYWEHPKGKKSIRINYYKKDMTVAGFNLMGVRYRHKVCERWIAEKTPLRQVMAQLSAANFDPEFFSRNEKEVVRLYNQQFPNAQARLAPKRKVRHLIFA